jgi:hypothetical protein
MNKLVYSFLFAFCLGYITNDFIHESKLSPIASAQAGVKGTTDGVDDEEMDLAALLQDLDFRLAVKEIVEDCIVEDNKIRC